MLECGTHWRAIQTCDFIKSRTFIALALIFLLVGCKEGKYEEVNLKVLISNDIQVNESDQILKNEKKITPQKKELDQKRIGKQNKINHKAIIDLWEKIQNELQEKSILVDDVSENVPQILNITQNIESENWDQANQSLMLVQAYLNGMTIDLPFIQRKIEKTLILLNQANMEESQHGEIQNKIIALDASIKEGKLLETNQELTRLVQDIKKITELNNSFE